MTAIYKSEEGACAVQERYGKFLSRWPVPNQQLRIPTSHGETFIVASGDQQAPPLLLLHGSAANSTMWMGDISAWSAHFRVYAIDLPGEPGQSARVRLPLESDAHARWLDEVMQVLSLERTSIIGMSLGGWLALDYATRRPERVESLVVLCPAGVGRQKLNIDAEDIPLWPKNLPAEIPPAIKAFMDFMALIHANFLPRREILPVLSDDALRRLTMPVMAIVGAKDVLLDSAETKARLESAVPHADIRYLPEAGHLITRQTAPILDFLNQQRSRPSAGPPRNESATEQARAHAEPAAAPTAPQ
jgi:pimeloyl-ACP methyl ester carboxylesterase